MDTKQKIIDALIETAYEKGLSNTSLSDIAKKVGINKASLYYYFPSKDALVTEMYHSIRNRSKTPLDIDTSKPLEEFLKNSFSSYYNLCTSSKMKEVFTIIETEKFINPEACSLYQEETKTMLGITRKIFEAYEKTGRYHFQNLDFATNTYALTAHELIILMVMDKKYGEQEAEKFITAFIQTNVEEK